MSDMTLPGNIPGLLRRGSPVVLATRTYGGSVFLDGARGVVCSDGGRVAAETLGGSPVLVQTGAGDLSLDLTDANGRAHAAQWLGSQRGLSGGMAADLRRNIGGGVVLMVWAPGWRSAVWTSVEVPALANLDPNDTRTLPDGSRWVDAEALRLVCLRVAGRAP